MKLSIDEAHNLAEKYCIKLGFPENEAETIAGNTIEAEISGKMSHGLGNLLWFKTTINAGGVGGQPINQSGTPIQIIKETLVSLFVKGQNRTGYVVMKETLQLALDKVKNSFIAAAGLTDTAPTTGFLGHYARMVAEQDLIFVCWNTSPGRVSPYGVVKRLWGTNPITVGVPTHDLPVITDMATAQITVGQLLKAQRDGTTIPEGSAINAQGETSTDPTIVWNEGSLLPIGGHKGSALSFINELLAGALTSSKVGFAVPGGWGTFFIIINPEIFRPIKDFKDDIAAGINELKSSPKRPGVTEIFYPGERSQKRRAQNLKLNQIEIPDELYQQLS